MKRIILGLSILSLLSINLFAQTDTSKSAVNKKNNEMRTIFKNPDNMSVGWYVAPDFAYTQFKTKPVILIGGSAGVMIDHKFSIGIFGKGIANSQNLSYDNIKDTTGYLYGGYGGMRFEYILNPNAPVHLSFPFLIGAGGLMYSNVNYQNNQHGPNNNNNSSDNMLDNDAFFVIEPGVMVGFNLLNFLRFDTGISYRYTPDLNLINTSSSLINNFNAVASLRFGKF